jgi:hypothetical protein
VGRGRYRKPFLLGRKSSARGRWETLCENSQIFISQDFRVIELKLGQFVQTADLYILPKSGGRRIHCSSARGLQVSQSL